MTTPGDLYEFLTADGVDAAGRRHSAILGFDDDGIERHHDFIQWLFPLAERSQAVPGSPVLDAATIGKLRTSGVARDRQAKAAARMLRFYHDTRAWRRAFDHNHLRITRIIKSLRLISGDPAADAFKRDILALASNVPIDAGARRFWENA